MMRIACVPNFRGGLTDPSNFSGDDYTRLSSFVSKLLNLESTGDAEPYKRNSGQAGEVIPVALDGYANARLYKTDMSGDTVYELYAGSKGPNYGNLSNAIVAITIPSADGKRQTINFSETGKSSGSKYLVVKPNDRQGTDGISKMKTVFEGLF